MNDLDDSSEPCLSLERTEPEDHNVKKCSVKLQDAYIEVSMECIDGQTNSNNIYDLDATSGCPPPSKDKDSMSFSWPRLSDVIPSPAQDVPPPPIQTQSTVPVKWDKHEYQTDSDITGELTCLSSPFGGSTAACSSSPMSKEKLCCEKEDQPFSNMLSEAVPEDPHGTFPPSSSPLQCSSPVEIMSSPVRQVVIKGEVKDESELNCLQRPVELLCRDGHVTDTDDKPDITRSGKRKRSESLSALDQFEEARNTSTHGNGVPNPKRLTAKSQRRQHEKLKTPFRSPLLMRPERNGGTESQVPKPVDDIEPLKVEPAEKGIPPNPGVEKAVQKSNIGDIRTKYRTTRAATQFKSPLTGGAATKLGKMVRMTPNIQALERKSQILKRALKIKQEDQERTLEELVRKWIDAGREVAWELWALVKDNGTSEYDASNKIKGQWPSNDKGWGWNEPERGRNECLHMSGIETDGACRNDVYNQAAEMEEEPLQNTLGVMLRQLGIDPETLGWDEGEGTFIDN